MSICGRIYRDATNLYASCSESWPKINHRIMIWLVDTPRDEGSVHNIDMIVLIYMSIWIEELINMNEKLRKSIRALTLLVVMLAILILPGH